MDASIRQEEKNRQIRADAGASSLFGEWKRHLRESLGAAVQVKAAALRRSGRVLKTRFSRVN